MQSDVEHIRTEQERNNYRFDIVELGGQMAKNDRIRKLIPIFERGRMYLRHSRMYTDYQGQTLDLIQAFVEEEYKAFPVMAHDDMLDCMARIVDPDLDIHFPSHGVAREMWHMPSSYEASRPQVRRVGR
jgi:hypothetical protein